VERGLKIENEDEYIVYECKNIIKMFRHIYPDDIKGETKYVNIKKLTGFGDLIPFDTLQYIYDKINKNPGNIYSRIFAFQKEPKELESTASKHAIITTSNKDPDYTGLRHCQEGQSAFVYKLQENVRFTQSGGIRKNKTKKHKKTKKHNKKTRRKQTKRNKKNKK
jgi:hypothetical protein